MDTVSFFLRTFLWMAAGMLLAWAVFIETGVMNFALFLFAALLAWGYSWLDKEVFGELVGHDREPASTVKEVEDDPYGSRTYPDTQYHLETPDAVARLLEDLRDQRTHIVLHYGNTATGLEESCVAGYVNRSSGVLQIPLLGQRGQRGGIPIMDHCIVQIVDLDKGFVLYQHPAYHKVQDEAATVEAAA